MPPSLLRELRLRKGIAPRVVSFADTIKAKSILSRSFRDSVGRELDSAKVSDSVLVMIDSAVSLSQKELLDSMLAELPEYHKTSGDGVFNYPSSILVETNAKVVPFDSSLIARMEPVIKEPTPYIDGFPTTPPLGVRNEPSIFFEAGVGYPTVPFGTIEGRIVSSPLTTITAGAGFHNNMGTINAIKNTWNIGANAKHIFMLDSLAADARQPQMNFDINYASRDRNVRMDTTTPDVTQNHLTSSLGLELGEIHSLYLNGNVSLGSYSDNLPNDVSESSFDVAFTTTKSLNIDHTSELSLDLNIGSYSSTGGLDSTSRSSSVVYIKPSYRSLANSPFEWSVGLSALLSTSEDVKQSTRILPYIELRKYLSDEFAFGFSYDPKAVYNGYARQSNVNPFYGAGLKADSIVDGHTPITVDNINFSLFAEQYLSADDYLRGTVRYITRDNDVVFREDSTSLFYTEVASTRHFEVELGGNVRLFNSDKLAAMVTFASTVSENDEKQLPFVPQMSIQSSYTFMGLSEKHAPKLEFLYTARADKSLAFINAEANYPLSASASLHLRLENIFGSPSDYWTGYTEYPRAIKASIKAVF
ncbi:MAG TPA: TonB-dependent receptor [Candidatus Kapabacteria bacterium]